MRVGALVLAVIAVCLLAWQAREESYQSCLTERGLPLSAQGTIRPGGDFVLGGTKLIQAERARVQFDVSEPDDRASCARWP
jgi:hypothetical protein